MADVLLSVKAIPGLLIFTCAFVVFILAFKTSEQVPFPR
jgi:hypothetical protein